MPFSCCDLCDVHGEALAAGTLLVLTPGFRMFGQASAYSGQVMTVKVFEDNSLVRATLKTAGQGRVLVVDGGGSMRCALVGDVLAKLAIDNGWSGIVVNGCIRDSAAISRMPIAIHALGTHPLRSDKRGEGVAGVPVSFGGVTMRAGDWLYADSDGILVSRTQL